MFKNIDHILQNKLHDSFKKNQNRCAINKDNINLSYEYVDKRTDAIANYIHENAIDEGTYIGVYVNDKIESILIILGILKARCVFAPLNPIYPFKRLNKMIDAAGITTIFTNDELTENLKNNINGLNEYDVHVINDKIYEMYNYPSDVLQYSEDDDIYIYFTSGTNGVPKAVVGVNKSLVHFIEWEIDEFSLNENVIVSQLTPFSHDPYLRDIFVPLFLGGKICIPSNQETILASDKITEWIDKVKISIIHCTPSLFSVINHKMLNDKNFKTLKYIFLAGEPIKINSLTKWYKIFGDSIQLVNLYGPTETTLAKLFYRIQPSDARRVNIPIGKPIKGSTAIILDDNLKPCRIGEKGQIFIRTKYMTRGYCNDVNLTQEKFIVNPFNDKKDDIIYMTGDYGILNYDGNIEFMGRIDDQVKIRGHRVELSEIEYHLSQYSEIKESVVVARKDDMQDNYICAYMTVHDDIQISKLKNYLKDILPKYMIPLYYIVLDNFPLTVNGKVNKKHLPEPTENQMFKHEYAGPRNKTDEILIELWKAILGKTNNIGIDDNFFDLGGNSLTLMTLILKIHKEFEIQIPLSEMLNLSTVRVIGNYIKSHHINSYVGIEKTEEKEYYEASSAQKRMYILQQLNKSSTAYNMPVVFELLGEINQERIEKALRNLIERHESLRTCFEIMDEEIVQKIQSDYEFKLEQRNEKGNIEDIIKAFIRPFELEKAPLFRVELLKASEEKIYLLIDMHHIISDGVSMSILTKEFAQLYNGRILEPLKIQYKDFATWQNNFLKSEEMKEQEEYWLSRFSDEVPALNMPVDYERLVVQSFEGKSVSFEINELLTLNLRNLARETKTTMHMVLLSAFNILLSKYSGQEDIVIGTPIAGRSHADLQNIMGMFVNTLALRNKPEGNKKYIDFLKEVKENSLKAYENQIYQFETLVKKLDLKRDVSRNPLFDVMLNIIDTVTVGDIKLDDVILKTYGNENKIAKFDLTLNVLEGDEKLSLAIDYSTKLFKKETIERLSGHYVRILDSIVNNTQIKLCDVDLLSETEKNQILYEFNNTKADYPKDKTINELFEEQVEKTPDNIAVIFEDKKLTYRELNERANSLARVLRDKGVRADSIIGIMAERSIEMIIGIIGILKAGGAYMPIDPNYPKERIEYILKDSECRILLCKNSLVENVEFDGIYIDLFSEELFINDSKNLSKINNSHNLAYVIYTSGTTGDPKGVMIEHKQVNNFIKGIVKETSLNLYKNILCITTICFDIFGLETLVPLTKGLNVIVANSEEQVDGYKLGEVIKQNNIEIMQSTPSRLKVLLEHKHFKQSISSLKLLLIGGEEVDDSLVGKLRESINSKIYNVYGPSETTIWSTAKELKKNEKVTIGKPISNTKVYIVNKNNNLLSVGVVGELCISGDGLARGYLNKPALTAEKFVNNPFETGTKMYKTGDVARWLSDGNIEFLGRIDNQVKIRGFRIELSEIENRILQHESIKEAAVLVKENENSDKHICAYVVSINSLEELNLKNYLKATLPEYMIPTYFVELEKMPLTNNGKLDRRSLLELNVDVNLIEYEAPRNEVEETLVKIWSELLDVKKIGINDNFFELGGHSLKATVLMSKIHKELNKEVPLKELFKSSTIKELSKYIEGVKENPYYKIEKVGEKEYYETSSAQKRMYIIQQFDKDITAYNMPAVFELEGKVDKNKIEKTFGKLTERHEALRTYFETLDGEIVQRLQSINKFKLEHRNKKGKVEDIIKSFIRPFDLEKAPLFRVELVENREKIYLLIDMHHIISDGVSMNILMEEFIEIYNGKTLEPLKLQYKDFAAWQNNFLKLEEMKKQEEYWVNRFSDEIPVLNMPTDYERPAIQSFEGDSVSFELNEEIILKLRKLTKKTGTTMHMALLSAFNILLSKYSGQEDIVVGTPIAGRPHADIQNIMGMFVNTIALRNKPNGNKKYIDFLKEVKENSLKAYENQSYQLEALIEKLDIRRDMSRNPLFDIMLNIIDMAPGIDFKLNDIELKPYSIKNKVSKFDLTLNILESDDKLSCTINYSTKLFKKETIERVGNHFIRIIDNIVNNEEIRLCEIDLLSEEERNQILYRFNDTRVDYPRVKTIHDLFEEQVERIPENIAVIFKDKKLTYRELNERSNSLARVLRDKGVKANTIVGIMVERSLEMIVGIMGILKSGGAYLPIDPNCPKERIEYMLKDSESKVLLSKGKVFENLEFDIEIIDLFDVNFLTNNSSNLQHLSSSNNLAYVIYTSGTTGQPKGVAIEHKGIINLTKVFKKEFKVNINTKILQFSSIAFDASAWEIYMSVLLGGELHIVPKEITVDIAKLNTYIRNNDINVVTLPPFIANEIEVKNSKLELIITAGSEAKKNIASKLSKSLKYINAYGPTEYTICATIWVYKDNDYKTVPIGKPINNTKVYVVSKSNGLLPIGIEGELCISGDGLARHYLNRTELTSEKFVDNPFEPGKKMYRTGDLARWLPDGNIEFLGRIDNQVKIRGFRIELGEIENRLLQHENIKETIVLVKESKDGEKYICAYIVNDNNLQELEIKSYLKETLPEYMIPAYFVQLEKIPLTTNGKYDVRALPEPNFDVNLSAYESPRNEVEVTLVKMCGEILGVEKVGINDSFSDLGGHSIKAIKLIKQINNEFGLNLSTNLIYRYQKIEEMSKVIEAEINNKELYNKETRDIYINSTFPIKSNENKDKFYESQNINLNNVEYIKNEFVQLVKEYNLQLNKNIKESRVISKIKCPPLQEYYLQDDKINKHIVPQVFEVSEKYVKETNNILKNIISNESIYRFILKKGVNKISHYIEEHECPKELNIPYIDLSEYNIELKMCICEAIIEAMNEEFELVDNIAYRIIVVKFDMNKTFILTFMSHFMTDGVGLVLSIQKNIYNESNSNDNIFLNSKSYKDYERDREAELEDISSEELNNYLMHYLEHVNIAKNFFDGVCLDKYICNSFFDFNEIIAINKYSINTVLVAIISRVLSKLHNKRQIPIKLLYNGRHFGRSLYNELLGDFHDNILINVNNSPKDNIFDIINKINEQLNQLGYSEVNNTNLLIESIRNNNEYINNLSFQTDITVNIVIDTNFNNKGSDNNKNYTQNKIDSLMKKYKKTSTDGVAFKIIYNLELGLGRVTINYPHEYSDLYKLMEKEFKKEIELLSKGKNQLG